ncbi:hypothetical protein [Legionella sainthelensi]|nr:hypothetical protein [Legionella sainthelensi]
MPYILPAAKHPALSLPETTGLARPSLPWPAAAENTSNTAFTL